MALIPEQSENPSISISAENANGERIYIVHVSGHLRAGTALSLTVDVQQPELARANVAQISEEINAFFAQVLARASATGIPVPVTITAAE